MNQPGRRSGGRSRQAPAGGTGRRGFTLIELLAVITIIAIILSLVLAAGMDAQRRAEERATQTLITKLETGLNDRLEALLQNRPEPNYAHGFMAAIWNGTTMIPSPLPADPNTGFPNSQVKQTQRAQVIAWYDYIKSELPDVFFIQNDTNYPINFAANPYPGTAVDPNGYGTNILPLGQAVSGPPPGGYGDGILVNGVFLSMSNPNLGSAGSGIFGASYPIAAGIYKNLGYLPTGYDAVDNNGNGLIDETAEGVNNTNKALVAANLQNHKHNTARSEMLYAILVEGRGPYGSVFSRDDFTSKEVQDTDGDGLPEFVDAWGQPIQFFRWPLLYHSDLQRGQTIVPTAGTAQSWTLEPPYYDPINAINGVFKEREQDPLDVNRQLMAPGWWSQGGVKGLTLAANSSSPFVAGPASAAPVSASNGVAAFESFFHMLTEPLPTPNTATGQFWDRGGFPYRRAFYSKFLVLSGGQDQVPGVFLYADADMKSLGSNAASFLISNENNALPFAMDLLGGGTAGFTTNVSISTTTFLYGSSADPTHPSSYDLLQGGQDDISNHNLQATGGIGGSG